MRGAFETTDCENCKAEVYEVKDDFGVTLLLEVNTIPDAYIVEEHEHVLFASEVDAHEIHQCDCFV